MLRLITLLFMVVFFAGSAEAQRAWTDVPEAQTLPSGERRIVPNVYRAVRFDIQQLQSVLAAAPVLDLQNQSSPESLPVLDLPMPNGVSGRFRIYETPVMHPDLQAKFTGIRTYTGQGIDDPTARLKCDLTPWGFHAMVMSATSGTIYIDPYVHGNTEYYSAYFKKDYPVSKSNLEWECGVEDAIKIDYGTELPEFQGDGKIRRYRLALACTGEYAAFHGGTKPLVLAAMNTTMNRVNGLYENDFSVTMQIVPNNDLIIYLNAATDPYTNNDGATMLGQNQTTCTNLIGSANYDIGHVFSTGGGGIAGLGVVCNAGNKARGVTGGPAPVGDPFDIDYVAHEMGHQFSGNHTFNNCGSANAQPSAVEPGSGTTIMAYAGICGATQNVQSNSDDYFHAYNVAEMGNFIYNSTGNVCPVKITTGNNTPLVNGGPNRTIPKSTPFDLTATGSDIDGDTLTYTWEQMDQGGTSPPATTNATGCNFRSFKGTTSPTRTFPRMQDIVTNANPKWEKLPSVARTMNFRVIARDNDWQSGSTEFDNVLITVDGASGPFQVTEPNTNVLWYVGDTKTVTWNVNGTNAGNVNCANVSILLSTDGGYNYPVVLAASVPNNGTASIVVPNNVSSTCRVRVQAVGNIFFDISNANFRIEVPPVPTFLLSTSTSSLTACAGETASFSATLNSVLGFTTAADVAVTGGPAGATIAVTPNPVTPTGTANISISDLTPAMAGNYTLTLTVTAGTEVKTATIALEVLPGQPATPSLTSPADGASGLGANVTLNWDAATFVDNYTVQVATSPSFSAGAIVWTNSPVTNSATTVNLTPGQVYYWRVAAQNDCGTTDYSAVRAFQVNTANCGWAYDYSGPAVVIDANSVNTVTSTINVSDNFEISDLNIFLQVTHTWVGDLKAQLTTPAGTVIDLFDQPGVPLDNFGCGGDNVDLVFDDQATNTAAQLEALCNGTAPALGGTYQPVGFLAAADGQSVSGTWTLTVSDNFAEDGGEITSWGIEACSDGTLAAGEMNAVVDLSLPAGTTATIGMANLDMNLSGTAAQGVYTVITVPLYGQLLLNGTPLSVGSTFTQADVNAGNLVYQHDGGPQTFDWFYFDALDQEDFGWVHYTPLHFNITQNNLTASASQTQAISCFNGTNGQITVMASGLNGDYTYSINGGTPQVSNVFSNLGPGVYTVTVIGQFGFTATSNTITLDNPAAIVASSSVTDDDVTVTATGGAGSLEYSLNGMTFQTSNTFLDLSNGVYTITVKDANNCTVTTQAIVAVNTLITTLQVGAAVTCNGGSNGTVLVEVGGGQSPFEFSLNGGSYQNSNVFTGLPAGTYTVTVRDALGFEGTTNSVTINEPTAIETSGSANLNIITVTATGGTGTLSYSLNGSAPQSTGVFTAPANGNYLVIVSDANSCTAVQAVNVSVPALQGSVVASSNISCYGANNGSIEVQATQGLPPYQYSLNGGAFQSSGSFTGLAAGAYTVEIRDAFGGQVSVNQSVTEPAQIGIQVSVTGNDATLSFNSGVSPYIYTLNGVPSAPTTNLPNGNYQVVATDANGCTNSTSFTVNYTLPTATSQVNDPDKCDGLANIVVLAQGGTPPYEYAINGGAFQNGNIFADLPQGNYTVVVKDALGDQTTPFAVALQPSTSPVISAAAVGDSIVASATGGQAPYQFSIDGVAFQSSPIFADLPNGTYTVTVRDANGCLHEVGVVVFVSGTVEPASAWGLLVSPNPSAGLFRLSFTNAPNVLRATLFDLAGRKLDQIDFGKVSGDFNTEIDLQQLPQGMYYLQLSDGQSVGAVRLSVVR
ncbi:MAG: proprotein convertase P-domain-containing protein [Saprospiraceae bacterium]|nr:proprotein convertase P-domain-containing protein [Saprospiraceae bacterium]